jgi:AGZA family xanthine/uracil permease-like MFS transporter
VIGILMLSPVAKLDFADLTELVPAALTIVLTAFTYNLGVGMTAGLVAHPLLKAATGRAREVPLAGWLLAAVAFVFYVVYPYHS